MGQSGWCIAIPFFLFDGPVGPCGSSDMYSLAILFWFVT